MQPPHNPSINLRSWEDEAIREGKMESLYILLVGINEYEGAPLDGCINDVEAIEKYLTDRYSKDRLHLVVLKNSEATKAGIKAAFRDHLRKASSQDSVWFHFSGHGTEAFAPEAFAELEPYGKDQNLVCYTPQMSTNDLLLADKEIAVLLEQVATENLAGEKKKSPHIVVSLDCCHSGSGTRDFAFDMAIKTRNIDFIDGKTRSEVGASIGIRGLKDYADEYYSNQLPGKLVVPAVSHVLLSACTHRQKAGDQTAGGVFTNGLLKALKMGQGELSYSDLFMRTRATVRGIRKDQTPQFETINNFDPFSTFLEGVPSDTPKRYEVSYAKEGKNWLIKSGAIYGLPTDTDKEIRVEIQTLAPENKPVAQAKVQGVGAQYSGLTGLNGEKLELDPVKKYQAVLRYLPATAVSVWVHGEEAGKAALKKGWDATENVLFSDDKGDSELEIEVANGAYIIRDIAHKRAVITYKEVEKVTKAIGLMVQWDRTIDLENPSSKIHDWANFNLGIVDKTRKEISYEGAELNLFASTDRYFANPRDPDSGVVAALFLPKIQIKKPQHELYAYLFHMRSDYSIRFYEVPIHFDPKDPPGKIDVEIPLWTGQKAWGLSGDEDATTSYLKVIVTTEAMDYQQLLQEGIKEDLFRAFTMRSSVFDIKNEWYTFTTKVEIARLNPNLAESAIELPGFNGNYAFTSARRIGHSHDPAGKFHLYEQDDLDMLRLNNPKQKRALEVLEVFPETSSHFEAKMGHIIASDEQVVAIAFDGKDFYQAGESVVGTGTVAVALRSFVGSKGAAEGSLVDNPFLPGEQQAESLFRNAKVAFFRKKVGFDMGLLGLQ